MRLPDPVPGSGSETLVKSGVKRNYISKDVNFSHLWLIVQSGNMGADNMEVNAQFCNPFHCQFDNEFDT